MYSFIKIINTYQNVSYIYDTNKHRIAKLPEYISDNRFIFTEEYIKTKKDMYQDLLDSGFFKGKPLDNIDNPLSSEIEEVIKKHLKGLTLQLTTSCNFACKYCFISEVYHHKKEEKNMKWEVAKKAIDYFMAHSEDEENIRISFYGGEPIINYSLIMNYIR